MEHESAREQNAAPAPKTTTKTQMLIAAVLFLAVTVGITWPLLAGFQTHVPAGSNDLHQNLWGLWWWKTALFDLHTSPYQTNLLYAPEGLDLSFHTHSPLNMLLTMGVNLLWGHIAAYNTAVLLAVFLSGLGAYLLIRELVDDFLAALAGGMIFAIFPQHIEQLFEHINLFSCQFIPFTLFFLVRTFRYGTLLNGVLTGVFFALNALASWHLGLLLILLGIPCFVWFFLRSPHKLKALGLLFPGAVASVLLLAPFLYPMVKTWTSGDAYFVKPKVYRPCDPAFLVLPHPQSIPLGACTTEMYRTHRGSPESPFTSQYAGFICYLGYVPLLLLIVLFFKKRDSFSWGTVLFWLLLFLGFLVLSFGDHLLFYGKEHPGIAMPQKWLQQEPRGSALDPVFLFFRVMRVANRYLIPGSLVFAILAAMGAASLKWKLLRAAAVVLIVLEFFWLPFPVKAMPHHPELQELAKEQNAGIVLDIPPCSRAAHVDNMIRQTTHRAPLLGGYAACIPPQKREQLSEELQNVMIGKRPPHITARFIDTLTEKGVRTILLKPSETREAMKEKLQKELQKGTLPFFLKHLKPNRYFPKHHMDLLKRQLQRFLKSPDVETEALWFWKLEDR